MPLRPAHVGRAGVIGVPVVKTAVIEVAVTPGRGASLAKTAVVAAAVPPRVASPPNAATDRPTGDAAERLACIRVKIFGES